MSTHRRLIPHAIAFVSIAVAVLAWDNLGMLLPSVDALLAPAGASLPELLAMLLMLVGRVVAVILIPIASSMLLADASLIALDGYLRRGERRNGAAG